MHLTRTSPARRNGFTLIEVVIASGMIAALILVCATIATANIQLANGIRKQQEENSLRESFFEMLKQQLGQLPGNTRMELRHTKGATPIEYTLILQNVPLAFTWGGVERIAKAVEISGVKRRDGFINVVMRYYENPILSDEENIADARAEEPFAEIVMMEGLRFFEWRALDGRASTKEWQLDWEIQGRLPLQLELVTAQGKDGVEMRQVFWIVPKISPTTVIRSNSQNQQSGSGNNGGNGEGGGSGAGGGSPPIEINPGGGAGLIQK